MATPAASALGNETMPAITAAARARAMVLGPRFERPPMLPRFAERSSSEMVARRPAIVHTKSWTIFGSMPESLARSALVAEAWTVWPNTVRFRNQDRPTASSGTSTRMVSFGPVILRPRTSSQMKVRGAGKR